MLVNREHSISVTRGQSVGCRSFSTTRGAPAHRRASEFNRSENQDHDAIFASEKKPTRAKNACLDLGEIGF
jgi:hypothetical protein